MKLTYDIDGIMFTLLKNTVAITSAISGDVYAGDRNINSSKEDIAINSIYLSQEYLPQLGTSNVNIHVPDMDVTIDGVPQKVENRAKLKFVTGLVVEAIRAAKVPGLKMVVEGQNTISEPDISQHYSNIRVNWIIH